MLFGEIRSLHSSGTAFWHQYRDPEASQALGGSRAACWGLVKGAGDAGCGHGGEGPTSCSSSCLDRGLPLDRELDSESQ